MKKITYTLITLLIISCASVPKKPASKDKDGNLIGVATKKDFQQEPYGSEWFNDFYSYYETDKDIIDQLKPYLKDLQIKAFMGTWCGDSKKEVPRLYKVLEACNFPMAQLENVAVSRKANMYKQSPQHEEKGLNIHRVPTVIFYKNGKEVNRIVEHPINTFEEDIQNIITKNDYKSNYQIVTEVNTIITASGLKGLKKNKKQLLKSYKDKLKSIYELNTYAHILFTTEKPNEAIEVLKINTKLFPEEPKTYINLANKLARNGNTKKATKALKKL